MALKFLNKKGWHTGSLRNVENVWKAEQKHEAEQKKLEELRKQIHEERERAEFRQLQEQAGLISSQERLEFLYDSGLAVGKGGSSFKALESLPKTGPEATPSSSTPAKPEASTPGALFEEKPQSANDAWRKLHSDPLLLIRQREQEALARIKNNPIKMSMIRQSVQVETKKNKDKDEKKNRKKHHKKKKHQTHSSSETNSDPEDAALSVDKHRESRHKGSRSDKPSIKKAHTSDEESSEEDTRRKKYHDKEYKDRRPSGPPNPRYDERDDQHKTRKHDYDSQRKEYSSKRRAHTSNEDSSEEDAQGKKYYESKDRRPSDAPNPKYDKIDDQQKTRKHDYETQRKEYSLERQVESRHEQRSYSNTSDKPPRHESTNRRRNPVKLSEEERAARLREMQMNAEIHEEQRWKRLKKAADNEAQEAISDRASAGRNFLDATQKSVYGAEKGGSATIEESVRRRAYYSQRGLATDGNAFRRS